MEQTVNWEKVYVDTLVRHTKDGGSIPLRGIFASCKMFAISCMSHSSRQKMRQHLSERF